VIVTNSNKQYAVCACHILFVVFFFHYSIDLADAKSDGVQIGLDTTSGGSRAGPIGL
jgi:hypothetical protein